MKEEIKVGDIFGRLKVIELIKIKGQREKIKVQCNCINKTIKIVQKSNLRYGKTMSCNCLKKEKLIKRSKHNLCKHLLYFTYNNILSRCYNTKDRVYNHYGQRGITVCDEWRNDFLNFYNWSIANGWKKGLTIDRTDNARNYEPSNCKWTTQKIQCNNKRNNHYLTAFNETKTVMEWVEDNRCLVNYRTLLSRIDKLNWEVEKAIITPSRERISIL